MTQIMFETFNLPASYGAIQAVRSFPVHRQSLAWDCTVVCTEGHVGIASVYEVQTGGDFSGTALSGIAAAATATTTCMAYDIGSIIEVNLNTSACSGRRVLENYTVEVA